ncbi:MAG: hypothetical protein L6R40_001890 [Gallowayella cf. fulva]|nr:MAG: hypothetical protein L6R40_001890 [Xanthomendoza cf. fulva]
MKQKLAEDGREASTQRRMMMENGHPGVEVDEAAIRRGENPYTKYYQQQGEQQLPTSAITLPMITAELQVGASSSQHGSHVVDPKSSSCPRRGVRFSPGVRKSSVLYIGARWVVYSTWIRKVWVYSREVVSSAFIDHLQS